MALNDLQEMELQEVEEILDEVTAGGQSDFNHEVMAETRERFKIRDLEQLNWAFRKLSALVAKQSEVDKLAQMEIERINQWHRKELAGITQSVEFFIFLVSEYMNEQRANDPKFKKVETPYGKTVFKKQQPEWVYEDEAAVIDYLKVAGHNHLIKIEEKPIKTDFKKFVEINGEAVVDRDTGAVIPGIKVVERPDKIEIKPEI
jgi:phage host-nuclease inhibitor protein Gam